MIVLIMLLSGPGGASLPIAMIAMARAFIPAACIVPAFARRRWEE
ncbi:hypothetical protein [Paraburkholderia sacchari]|nr:hypothetical protein [Paraburkholderia sacchari]